jgi:integrase
MSVVIRKSKSGKPRRAPLDQRAAQHIARWLAKRATYPVPGGDALWVGRAGPLSSDGVRQVIERRRREAGVDISAHAFRRGWAAHSLGARGISQSSVMTAAGWTTPTMPSLYIRSVRESVMLDEFHREGR